MAAIRTCCSSTSLLLLLLALCGVFRSSTGKYIRSYCPMRSDASCSCNPIDSDYEVDCPPIEPDISVRVKPNEQVHVYCQTGSDSVYERLPPMQLGNISMVRIQKCPSPAGGTAFAAILERLGIQNTRTLMLSDGGSTLVRQHFAGLGELQRLIIQKSHLTEMPDDLFADLGNLMWLDMRSNSVHLTVNSFRHLHRLEVLELGYNLLESLKPGLFHQQKRLRQLILWGNNLKYLTRAELEGLSTVQDLDLSGNYMETMEPGVFDDMTGLSVLHLSANPFRSLPDGLLANTRNLSRFTLTDNRATMDTVPAGLFANLTRLEKVDLGCGLQNVPEDLFAGAVNLKNITLKENELTVLPVGLFDGLTQVLDLDLSFNKLQTLEDGVFESLGSVLVLRLNNNQLTEISDNLLIGMKSLEELLLGDNRLRTIGDHAFRTTERLHNLQLPNNNLSFATIIDEAEMIDAERNSPFHYLRQLRTLNLHRNALISMLSDWSVFNVRLERLDVSYNQIRAYSSSDLQGFAADGSTVVTNLTHNAITQIDFSMLEHQTQRNITFDVYLDHNPIGCNCQLIQFVQFMADRSVRTGNRYDVRLHVDALTCAAPAAMKGRAVRSVRDKELLCELGSTFGSRNNCPEACTCLVRPVDFALIVNCSGLGLTSVPELPVPVEYRLNATELHVQNNQLTSLPNVSNGTHAISGYDYVTEIHANHNNISQLLATNIPVGLRTLNVRHNRLHAINQSVLQQFNRTNRLHHISLGGNPWRCDCDAKALLIYTQNHGRRLADLEAMRCNGDGRPLQEHRLGDLCPEDHTMVVVASLMMLMLGLSAGILVAFYYKYQQEVKVWLFAHNLLACLVTEEELDGDKKFDAFVSYSHKDHVFVSDCIVQTLEKGEQPYRLCVHERDWLVGGAITQSIADSVENSRRTIIVLTKNFVESDWGKMEFRVAHKKALSENRARVIVIVCGELQDMKIDTLDAEMRAYLQTNTYIKWGDPWFWKKLRYAMPHLQQPTAAAKAAADPTTTMGGHHHTDVLHRMKALKGGMGDDKLDLIKPQGPPTPPTLTTPPAELAGQKFVNGLNGTLNGHVNGAFIINTNAKQSDV